MANRAQVCPVCNGSGKYKERGEARKCHGCGGKGWVVVPQFTPIPSDIHIDPPPRPWRRGEITKWMAAHAKDEGKSVRKVTK